MKAIGRAFLALGRVIRRLWRREVVLVSAEVREARAGICGPCQYNGDGICRRCSCVIGVKILLASERCADQPARWKAL